MPDQYNQRAQRDRKGGPSAGRRFAVLQRYNFHCQYCGEDASCVDHIVPWSFGGSDDDDNLVAACHICNLIASGKVFDTIDEKRAHILARRHERKASGREERRNRIPVCPCGSPFQPNIDGASNVLCGRCYLQAARMRETSPLYDVTPPHISNPTGDAETISVQVQITRVKLPLERACRICGAGFDPEATGFRVYCSRECKREGKQLRRNAAA